MEGCSPRFFRQVFDACRCKPGRHFMLKEFARFHRKSQGPKAGYRRGSYLRPRRDRSFQPIATPEPLSIDGQQEGQDGWSWACPAYNTVHACGSPEFNHDVLPLRSIIACRPYRKFASGLLMEWCAPRQRGQCRARCSSDASCHLERR
jgi:hypothetical protein